MFKLKKLFTSRNIENCSVILAIGLVVFFTIDMYILSTIEGNAINFTPGPDTCPTCYNRVPKTIRQYVGTALKHEKDDDVIEDGGVELVVETIGFIKERQFIEI